VLEFINFGDPHHIIATNHYVFPGADHPSMQPGLPFVPAGGIFGDRWFRYKISRIIGFRTISKGSVKVAKRNALSNV
jgi:hypothetical protein